MKRQTKAVILSLCSATSLLASEVAIDRVGVNLGFSSLEYSQKNSVGALAINETSSNFATLEAYTELKTAYSDTIKPYISYTFSQNTDLRHHYLLVGANKYFEYKMLQPYVGLVVGYGELEWRENPLAESQTKSMSANSFIGGAQAGLSYPLADHFSLTINAKYLLHAYETKLTTPNARATLENSGSANISMGLGYSFPTLER